MGGAALQPRELRRPLRRAMPADGDRGEPADRPAPRRGRLLGAGERIARGLEPLERGAHDRIDVDRGAGGAVGALAPPGAEPLHEILGREFGMGLERFGERQGHRGVIGPRPGLERKGPAADQVLERGALIAPHPLEARPQRIANRQSHQTSDRPIMARIHQHSPDLSKTTPARPQVRPKARALSPPPRRTARRPER